MSGNETPTDMQTDLRIGCCGTHSTRGITGHCNDCREFFCEECSKDHAGHATVKLEDFCEEGKKSVLSQISTRGLSIQLEERRAKMVETRKTLKKDRKDAEKAIRIKEEAVKDKEENISLELARLEAVTRCIVELEDEASTVAFWNACEEAKRLFDLEDEIREEFETLEKSLADTKIRVKDMDKERAELKEEIEILDYLRGDGRYEFDDDKWTTFLLLNEKVPLFTPPGYCINTTVDNFRSFPFVEDVFDIDATMGKELVDVGEGVRMTQPLKVDKNLLSGDSIHASLSH